jgi:hypothetical protein
MITRNSEVPGSSDVWERLALSEEKTVREALDQVVPGEWDITLETVSVRPEWALPVVKARLQILGVIREGLSEPPASLAEGAAQAIVRAAALFGVKAKKSV